MTATQAFTLNDILKPLLKNEGDVKQLLTVVEDIYDDKIEVIKKDFSSKSELDLLRKDMEFLRNDLKSEIDKSALRVENSLKSEINKLIIWIIGIIFTAAVVFFALSKFVNP